MISSFIITSLYISTFLLILFPIVLIILFRYFLKYSLIPALAGSLTFIIFSQILEAIVHNFCIIQSNQVSHFIYNSTFFYVLYGISMAGLFEEIGRFLVFTVLFKKYKGRLSSISFGLGHGGIENIVVAALLTYTLASVAKRINDNTIDELIKDNSNSEYSLNQVNNLIKTVENMDIFFISLLLIERIFSIVGHIDLSIIVFKGVIDKNKGEKIKYLIIAILIHMLIDLDVALYQKKIFNSRALVLFLFVIKVIILTIYAKKIFYSIEQNDETIEVGVGEIIESKEEKEEKEKKELKDENDGKDQNLV